MEIVSLIISIVALCGSVFTFWLTRVRKGKLRMTKPTVIYFGPDGPEKGSNKVFVRALLYSSSDLGHYIENMYVRLTKGESTQNFNVWVYGDKNDGLSRGSGLFVNREGVATNHHFLLPKEGRKYDFSEGKYQLEFFVELVNQKPQKLLTQFLEVSSREASQLETKNCGLYFDWAPNSQSYSSHVDDRNDRQAELKQLLSRLNTQEG